MGPLPSQAALPASLAPRGLQRIVAAQYVGVSASTFDKLVEDGRMPRPKAVGARRIWDREALDSYFAALPDEGQAPAGSWDDV